MNSSNVIDSLVNRHKPYRKLPGPGRRAMIWLALSLCWISLWIGYFGFRPDLNEKLREPKFLFDSTFSLCLCLFAIWATFVMSVPGLGKKRIISRLILGSTWVWIAITLIGELLSHGSLTQNFAPGPGLHCVRNILGMSLIPAPVLFIMIRKAAPLRPLFSGALAMLAVGSLAAFATQLICRYDFPMHFLVWHFLPILTLLIVGRWLGSRFLKWPVSSSKPSLFE